MKKDIVMVPSIHLVGISVRTSNEQEVDKINGKMFPLIRRYFHEGVTEQIPHRKHPGTTYCVYTDYETDHNGEYTYFIGEEVTTSEASLPEGFQKLVISNQQYAKFTNGPAPMPEVIVDAWKEILEMSPEQLGGDRSYKTDFEIYDERSADHHKIVLDIYIGIKS